MAAVALSLLTPRSWDRAEDVLPPSALYDVRDKDEFKPEWIVLPFAFSTDSFDFTIGVGGGGTGYLQEQAGLYGAALTTANQTHAFYFLGTNLQRAPNGAPLLRRSLLDGLLYRQARLRRHQQSLISRGSGRVQTAPATTTSSPTKGMDSWGELKFKYILPMGGGREAGFLKQTLDRGLLVSEPTGASTWNPLKSGLTMLYLEPFYRYRSVEFGEVLRLGQHQRPQVRPHLRQPGLLA